MKIKNKIFNKIIFLWILFSFFFYNNASANLDDWLIGYWNFDQCNFVDSTVIQSNWTPYWTPTCVPWISGNAFRFGWVYDRDFAIIWNTSELTINDNFTFNMWFNIQWELSMDWWWGVSPNWAQIILAKAWDRSGVNIWLWKWIDWKWYLSASNWRCCTSAWRWIWWTRWVWLNEWHMMSFSDWLWYTRIYLDWELVQELPETEFNLNPATANQRLQISIWEWAYRYPFNWIVDELKIYNRVLDASEVNKLYSNLTKVNSPTNLSQIIKSPELDEEEIAIWTKIWKFQSGSGIILRADTDETESSRLIVNVYRIWENYPITFSSDYNNSKTKEIVIPYLWIWDYKWESKIERQTWWESDIVDFWNNPSAENDFSLFEGFEPYPYGYKFTNSSPVVYNELFKDEILTWWIYYENILWFNTWYRKKIDWNKWDIFNSAFATSWSDVSYNAMLDAFEILWLNNKEAFQWWNCYWMAVSAAMQYKHSDFLNKYFPEFSSKVWLGNIRNNIEKLNYSSYYGAWTEYNDVLKTILSFQFMQYNTKQYNLNLAYTNPLEIYETIKNNPNKTYVLNISWKKENNSLFSNDLVRIGHTVIPYKVENINWIKRIYFRDNNVEFPKKDYDLAYNQYIELYNDWNWKSTYYKNRKSFDYISLVNIDDIYNNNNKSLPMGFNIYDVLFTLKWSSDIILSDSIWRISGFSWSEIYEQIPWVKIITPLNDTLSWSIENTWKQIYLPQKIDWLTLKVWWKTSENYDLMIAWWDYYTKLSWINKASWQTDTYNISRENIKIDFDDNKIWTGTYDILVDNFQNNWTWTVYIPQIEEQKGLQTVDINWTNVVNNSSNAVVYKADTNNDWIVDISKSTKAIENPQDTNTKKSGISWKINISEDYSMWKKIDKLKYNDIILMLEKEKDEKDEHEEKEWKEKLKDKIKDIFIKRQLVKIKEDWTFDINNLEAWKYKLEIVNDNLMNKVIKPETWHYELEIKKGFDYINKDFDIIKWYKLKELKDKLDNLKHK